MRVALISDIHGNALALDAVLADIERADVDRVVCLGDVATLGPHPGAVIETLRRIGCPCILGNHDAFLIEPELIRRYTEDAAVVEAVEWCRKQLSREDLDFLRGFESDLELPLDGEATLYLFHGSPRSHMQDLLATTPPDDLDRLLAGRQATVMAGGHTHIQMLRQHRGMLLVNPGSVGAPFMEYVAGRKPTLMPSAEYATVEARDGDVRVDLRRLALDRAQLREAARSCDNPFREMLLKHYA